MIICFLVIRKEILICCLLLILKSKYLRSHRSLVTSFIFRGFPTRNSDRVMIFFVLVNSCRFLKLITIVFLDLLGGGRAAWFLFYGSSRKILTFLLIIHLLFHADSWSNISPFSYIFWHCDSVFRVFSRRNMFLFTNFCLHFRAGEF